ncbi:putative acetylornithine/succinylornithine family transaminase [Haloferula luteola]|uniref:Putative acetylornithine/succinylornithine family transaminase n=1 Tax=Haloferula luteola TaxID=595692 RepID=A0A840VB47_9BACT|nr:acetylornithine transaminase [Haloferula luteola]MBB5352774.1 putative acetylornithine/succinylornithine family transaminase [Haloferula luteola]
MSSILSTYGRFPLTLVQGQGTRVQDDQGRSYLDFCSGIAVCSLGHSPKVLVDAISQQAATLIHCCNLYHIPQQEELARCIVEEHVKLPGKVFFSNSGAESNDGLIKSARRFGHARPQADGTPRYEVVSFLKSFHGRTLGGINATGQDKVKEGFDPMLPGFRHVPFNDLEALEAAIQSSTAAILLEPIQGEGGVHVATPEFLRGVKALCEKHDLLLLLDEVQTGFGRCGDPMAWREIVPELAPDGISWAKGLGGGFPIGAFWLSDRLIDGDQPLSSLMGPGSHGTTYGGSPLACAAALAVLREIQTLNLIENVRAREAQIRETVASWNHPLITDVRGVGLLLGIGLDTTKMQVPEGKLPAIYLSAELISHGLLAPPAGPETLRLLPPLNVSEDEVAEALEIVRTTLDSLKN